MFVCRSEELRKARNEEARQLIGQRSSNPRAVFERNTSVGQLNYRRQTSSSTTTATTVTPHVISEEPKPKLAASPVPTKETFQGEHRKMMHYLSYALVKNKMSSKNHKISLPVF